MDQPTYTIKPIRWEANEEGTRLKGITFLGHTFTVASRIGKDGSIYWSWYTTLNLLAINGNGQANSMGGALSAVDTFWTLHMMAALEPVNER